MSDREREILHAELRGSAAEFMGWLTGLKPPEDKEAIPPEMRGAFDRMVDRMQSAVMRCANERAEWQDISTAPKDGRWIIARCNDHSQIFLMSWGRDRIGRSCWCSQTGSYGDGLFTPRGGWIPAPQPVAIIAEERTK